MNLRTLLAATLLLAGALAPAPSSPVLRYRAAESAAFANSWVLIGAHDLMLVDVVETRAEATRLADLIASLGKPLTTVFITHAHPDHYLGLDVIAERFPTARIVATAAVVAELRRTGPAMAALLGQRWGANGPTRLVVPETLPGDSLPFDGGVFRIHEFTGAESSVIATLYRAETGELFAGDLIYNGVHLFLREKRTAGWLVALARLEELLPLERLRIYPGHGAPCPAACVALTRQYLRDFLAAVALPTGQEASAYLLRRYPDWAMPAFLTDYSLPAWYPESTPDAAH